MSKLLKRLDRNIISPSKDRIIAVIHSMTSAIITQCIVDDSKDDFPTLSVGGLPAYLVGT